MPFEVVISSLFQAFKKSHTKWKRTLKNNLFFNRYGTVDCNFESTNQMLWSRRIFIQLIMQMLTSFPKLLYQEYEIIKNLFQKVKHNLKNSTCIIIIIEPAIHWCARGVSLGVFLIHMYTQPKQYPIYFGVL